MFGGTKCGKCGGATFSVETIEPSGSQYKLIAVQCQSCKTPFGVTDYYNVGSMLKKQEDAIQALGNRLQRIEGAIHQIADALRRRR